MTNFEREVRQRLKASANDAALAETARAFTLASLPSKYSYNWFWLGRPIIQYPQDIVAMQELIWLVKPDLIIETGIAHGGSLIFSASQLALLDLCEAAERRTSLDPNRSSRKVIGIDIDIRPHNRDAIEAHPLASRIQMIEGSSVAPEIVEEVHQAAKGFRQILVCLDSNHTHDHVLAELQAYAPLSTLGSYCVVFDTVVEDIPKELCANRPWGPGNNPKTAVREFLTSHSEFQVDQAIHQKLQITMAPDGYLKRVA